MLTSLYRYINPIEHLGDKKYSLIFPFLTMLVTFALIEALVYLVLKDPMAVGNFAIFIPIALIVYFAFRDGIIGGFIAAVLTVAYYFYIIYSRHYTGNQLQAGVDTTIILGALFLLIALIIGWLKITIDSLIEREANEKRRLQAIIQQLPVGVMITDEKGVIVQSNKQVESILGMKVPEHFVAGKDKLFKNPTYKNKSVPLSQGPLTLALATEKTIVGREYEIDRPDNKRGYLLVSATPIHNRKGQVIAAASILQDITEQKEMETRKDDFVNMASHELKTPITSMKLYIDSLTKQIKSYNDQRANKTLASIKYQTERLQELVSDLLDVSRLQTGKLLFTKEQFRLDGLIEETVDGLQGTTKNQKIVFSKKIPVVVLADRFRIYQVLTNLLTNAVKYSPEGKEIIVQLKRSDGKALVSVKDSGIGIAKDQQKKIFDRLYQVTDSKEKTFPGLGMGLYISKEIMKRHKGNIWVESEKDKGSTFFFSLPLTKKAV